MRFDSGFWLSRSLPVLVAGPTPLGHVIGIAGAAILVALEVQAERRAGVERRAYR